MQALEIKNPPRKPITTRADSIDKNNRSLKTNTMKVVELSREMQPTVVNQRAEFDDRHPVLLNKSTYLNLSEMRDAINVCELILSHLSTSFKIAIRHKYKAGNAGDLWRCVISYLFIIGDDPEERKAFNRALTEMDIQEVGG